MTQSALGALSTWRSPYLGESCFGCLAISRDRSTKPSPEELDDLVKRLPQYLDFEARFFECAGLDWPAEPDESDFESPEEYEDAYQAFYRQQTYEPKPWELVSTDLVGIQQAIEKEMRSIGGKQIREEDVLATRLLADFMNSLRTASQACKSCWLFETEHLLDTHDPPKESKAAAYAGCFYDHTFALCTDRVAIVVWTGYPRAYG